jgi:hypothetical protein
MVEDPADEKPRLAVGGELRPIAGDRRVEVDEAAVDQHVDTGRGDALADRHAIADRVLEPALRAGGVAITAPEVDDRLAADRDRDRCANLFAKHEILGEGLPYRRDRPPGRTARNPAHMPKFFPWSPLPSPTLPVLLPQTPFVPPP